MPLCPNCHTPCVDADEFCPACQSAVRQSLLAPGDRLILLAALLLLLMNVMTQTPEWWVFAWIALGLCIPAARWCGVPVRWLVVLISIGVCAAIAMANFVAMIVMALMRD